MKAAAQYYFKTSAGSLSVVQSAFLAMILPNPIKYSTSYRQQEMTKFARKRMDRIINDMYRYHRITEEEYNEALLDLSTFLSPAPPPVNDDQERSTIEDELNDSMFNSDDNSYQGPQSIDEIQIDSSEDLDSTEPPSE